MFFLLLTSDFFSGGAKFSQLANFFPKWQKREEVCLFLCFFLGFSSFQLFRHYVAKNVKCEGFFETFTFISGL
jgi:hypothetical protein